MDKSEALSRLAVARSGHLATIRPDGTPHIVVATFALVGDVVVTAVDHKPKRTTDLQRLRNIAANPAVSFLVDEYNDDWSHLWWVRVDGRASVATEGELHGRAVAALADKYEQYRQKTPAGQVISITADSVTGWEMTA